MKGITNNTMKDLTWDEMQALMNAGKEIEKAFGRKVFAIYVNAGDQGQDPTRISGLGFMFDKNETAVNISEQLSCVAEENKPTLRRHTRFPSTALPTKQEEESDEL